MLRKVLKAFSYAHHGHHQPKRLEVDEHHEIRDELVPGLEEGDAPFVGKPDPGASAEDDDNEDEAPAAPKPGRGARAK
jgi:hypothetical protein